MENYLYNIEQYLKYLGHVNIEYLTNIYQEGGWQDPDATYIEYLDKQGIVNKNPLDISMGELNKIIINMPTVELQLTEE